MVGRISDHTTRAFNISIDKRPRSPNKPVAFIDLTSDDENDTGLDEERPRKRQKSTTPSTVNILRHNNAKTTSFRQNNAFPTTTPPPSHDDTKSQAVQTSAKKPSPWRNRPSWQSQYLTSQAAASDDLSTSNAYTEELSKWVSEGNSVKPSNGWTHSDDQRLRSLSLSQAVHASARVRDNGGPGRRLDAVSTPNSHSDNEEERESIVEQFKLHTAVPLKFNPSNSASVSEIKVPKKASHQQTTTQAREHTTLSHNPRSATATSFSARPASAVQENKPKPKSNGKAPPKAPPQSVSAVRTTLSTIIPSSSSSVRGPGLGPVKPPQDRKFLINVPLIGKAKWNQERKAVQEKLKQGSQYAKEHAEDVKRYLGLTGFSTEFPDNLNTERYHKAAQPKKRVVDRSRVSLEIGHPESEPSASTTSDDSQFVHPKEQLKATLTARFSEEVNPPLTFSNTVNDRRLNGKFQFVPDYILRKGVKATGSVGQPGCVCTAGCGLSCLCLQKRFNEKSKQETIEHVPQYERHPSGLMVLRDDFIKRHIIVAQSEGEASTDANRAPRQRVEISECNEQCSCDDSCTNRVVQKGRTVPLEIFETNRCGFGVRSAMNLVRGQFIEVYLGEVITENELGRREAAAEAGSTSYILSLDWFSSQQVYHIDGQNFGSAMRFVNHSCDPNAATFPVLNNKSSRQLHYVAFFALKDIPAGTEITIDYTPQAAGQMYELKPADEGMEQCHCEARNCRRMLWLPGKERKARKKTVGKSFD